MELFVKGQTCCHLPCLVSLGQAEASGRAGDEETAPQSEHRPAAGQVRHTHQGGAEATEAAGQ